MFQGEDRVYRKVVLDNNNTPVDLTTDVIEVRVFAFSGSRQIQKYSTDTSVNNGYKALTIVSNQIEVKIDRTDSSSSPTGTLSFTVAVYRTDTNFEDNKRQEIYLLPNIDNILSNNSIPKF